MDPVISNEDGARFSPLLVKSKRYCRVDGCPSKANADPSLRFHLFPMPGQNFVDITNKFGEKETVDQRKAWEIRLRIGSRMARKITKATYICSLHFKKDDYILPDIPAKKRYLKRNAVPSCNLPKITISANKLHGDLAKTDEAQRNLAAKRRCQRRADRSMKEKEKNIMMNERKIEEENIETVHADEEEEDFEPFPPTFQEIGTQVTSGDLNQFRFVDLITSDEKLNTLTGIPNHGILEFFVSILTCISPKVKVKVSPTERVIMTFMKLKQNISYAVLSVLFACCTAQNCKLIMSEILDVLSTGLRSLAIPWPSKQEVLRNIPQCFSDFCDVRCVIDCIEMTIQKPKKKCCQLATYSHYKGNYTIKFMTGVTPAGLISFVSKAYGGRSSDKAIFEQSNLINLLERNDALMTDKGFLVDDICKNNDIKLVRPPFLRKKKQFSKVEALLNAKIAHARVHVERSNQRLKTFKILSDKLPGCLLHKSEQIFSVICALVNLGSPILSNSKFGTSALN